LLLEIVEKPHGVISKNYIDPDGRGHVIILEFPSTALHEYVRIKLHNVAYLVAGTEAIPWPPPVLRIQANSQTEIQTGVGLGIDAPSDGEWIVTLEQFNAGQVVFVALAVVGKHDEKTQLTSTIKTFQKTDNITKESCSPGGLNWDILCGAYIQPFENEICFTLQNYFDACPSNAFHDKTAHCYANCEIVRHGCNPVTLEILGVIWEALFSDQSPDDIFANINGVGCAYDSQQTCSACCEQRWPCLKMQFEGYVHVRVESTEAASINSLYLEKPFEKLLCEDANACVGYQWALGPYLAGQDVVLRIYSSYVSETRYPRVIPKGDGFEAQFEDWTDMDYNDVICSIKFSSSENL
jgi:hypothetical protein